MDLVDVPEGFGVLLYLDSAGAGRIRLVKDAHHEDIHEHLHAPHGIEGLRSLTGGGSGVTIVRGIDKKFGDIVIKHGGHKDTSELFALATIDEELRLRSRALHAESEAAFMRKHTSDFSYVFMSQDHLREVVKATFKRKDSRRSVSSMDRSSLISSKLGGSCKDIKETEADKEGAVASQRLLQMQLKRQISPPGAEDEPKEEKEEDTRVNSLSRASTMKLFSDAKRGSRLEGDEIKELLRTPSQKKTKSEVKKNRRATSWLKSSASLVDTDEQDMEESTSSVRFRGMVKDPSMDSVPEHEQAASEAHVLDSAHTHALKRSVTTPLQVKQSRRDITICTAEGWLDVVEDFEQAEHRKVEVQVDRLAIRIEEADISSLKLKEDDEASEATCSNSGSGYKYFETLFKELAEAQAQNNWKFSLAQKSIGTATSKTGSALLGTGLLEGDVLRTLIDKFLTVIRNLQKLTRPAETKMVDQVRAEVYKLSNSPGRSRSTVPSTSRATSRSTSVSTSRASSMPTGRTSSMPDGPQAADISKSADAFVGFAIKKNFDHAHGRFRKLRGMGLLFDSGCFVLPEPEVLPGVMIGWLLKSDTLMENVFRNGPTGPTAFTQYSNSWLDLLELAVKCKGKAAKECIWTCGLTDAGLHNLFLDNEDIYLFDLGEPSLQPLPAFLTKFLMSFFHVLGMQDSDEGGWVNNFRPCKAEGDDDEDEDSRLELTEQARACLAQAHKAFHETLKHIIFTLFEGAWEVCELLVRYVILQLLSDAAFCLDKWEVKGGGVDRSKIKLGNQRLEKWLWRTLWDLYVATYVADVNWCEEVGCEEPRSSSISSICSAIGRTASSVCMCGSAERNNSERRFGSARMASA